MTDIIDKKRPDVYVYTDFDNGCHGPKNPGAPRAFIKAFSKRELVTKNLSIYDAFSMMATGGTMGKSAYEIWLDVGNEGTVEDFLNSLNGTDGVDGLSAYQIWLGLGNTGTEEDFINSLVGESGKSAYDIWIEAGNTGTPEEFLAAMRGADGKSAYEVWLGQGHTGTIEDFFVYLAELGSYEQAFDNVSELIVEHNLGKHPCVFVLDADNNECEVGVTHLSENSVQINMSAPRTGRVFCN